MKQLYQAGKTILTQLADVVNQITEEDFRKPSTALSSSTVGQHLRHTLEFFICLEQGYESAIVNYDKRIHNKAMENDKHIALHTISQIQDFVIANQCDKALKLEVGYEPDSEDCVTVETNYLRELIYNIEHAVHHMAIMKLVDSAHSPSPRQLSVGLEQNRLAMLLAVLHRHAGVVCFDQDVFVNAVGGVKIAEPAADLAVLLAIVSSLTNRPLPRQLVVFGEVGLAGEIRPAPRGQERLKESAKLGFTVALVPRANAPKQEIAGMQVIAVERIEEALERLRELANS